MKDELLQIIFLLNDCNLPILMIDEQLYVVISWTPADDRSFFHHYLSGILITDLIKSKLTQSKQGLTQMIMNELITMINSSKTRNIEFSKNIEWKLFKS